VDEDEEGDGGKDGGWKGWLRWRLHDRFGGRLMLCVVVLLR
jgi:hypothetical protein